MMHMSTTDLHYTGYMAIMEVLIILFLAYISVMEWLATQYFLGMLNSIFFHNRW